MAAVAPCSAVRCLEGASSALGEWRSHSGSLFQVHAKQSTYDIYIYIYNPSHWMFCLFRLQMCLVLEVSTTNISWLDRLNAFAFLDFWLLWNRIRLWHQKSGIRSYVLFGSVDKGGHLQRYLIDMNSLQIASVSFPLQKITRECQWRRFLIATEKMRCCGCLSFAKVHDPVPNKVQASWLKFSLSAFTPKFCLIGWIWDRFGVLQGGWAKVQNNGQ